ncbi:ABC transporter ATP-binding protein [Geomonas subterranea]|uniref:ABC transporter ATP-binding protein n=1 Tax=Geomonas subterranea TaxID=2847989 RepID=A0ABX8LQY1_9BACT|nr:MULTISPECIES: ABC transporter ATP-binding protein [Geomonas]QXE91935.1 ABC transporter ATP-binding protein [Geomonas subterranea]QXM09972.1 ABC transporter ATP-binding protein [Geomonas subterranea]
MAEPVVELKGIGKSFREGDRERVVLRDASLSIDPGSWVFLLGRSGSGKSTLLNLISGIDLPDQGDVVVDGAVLNRLGERERTLFRRNHIGFVFQFYNLIPTLTVEENVLLPLELAGLLTPAQRRRAIELLDAVGIADRARAFPDRLSGGEQQRVAVARALVHAPKLVLADEPTGNLDAETGRQVLDLFERLLRPAGTTLVLVTHSGEVASLADRVLSIKDGVLVDGAGVQGAAP